MSWVLHPIIASFDIPYILRQSALMTLIIAVPLIVISLFGRRWWLWVITVASISLWFGVLSTDILWVGYNNWRSYALVGLPYRPFRIGPSVHSMLPMLRVGIVLVWVPSLLIMALRIRRLRRRNQQHRIPAAMVFPIILVLVLGTLPTWPMTLFAPEDTVWADGFTFKNWNRVEAGMTRQQVVGLLGEPFPEPVDPQNLKGKADIKRLVWARHYHSGYYAFVWFDHGRVHRKEFWFDD